MDNIEKSIGRTKTYLRWPNEWCVTTSSNLMNEQKENKIFEQ